MSVVLGGGGVYWSVVGWGSLSPVFKCFLGGFPEWGHFGGLGLGLGCLWALSGALFLVAL